MENSSDDSQSQLRCFKEWMSLQEEDLSELLNALNLDVDGVDRAAQLRELVQKGINHFEDYINKRASFAREDTSSFFSPTWCSTLEGSLLWAGGCRPSIFIRLLYCLCGNELTSNLEEYLEGRRTGSLGELSAAQMNLINTLQLKTLRLEDALSSRLASLQEELADRPIAIIVKQLHKHGESSREAEEVLNQHEKSMMSLLEEADKLRLETLKEIMTILTPVQAVDLLATSKKLHLCLHAWGTKRDQRHGRC